MAAGLLGKKAALFVPSGTMANQLAIRIQTQPGQEVIVESKAHIVRYEQGAAGALAGVQLHWVIGDRGIMGPEQVEAAIRPKDPYSIHTALICLENTHNSGGGTIYPLATIERIRAVASAHHIPMHLDGARLFNAVAATTLPPASYAQHFETVSVCLSKGLGAPAGSLLLTNDLMLIEKARRFRRMYGGAMRQAGILAAAGSYALAHNVERLADDHANARLLADELLRGDDIEIDLATVQTNIIVFTLVERRGVPDAATFVEGCRERGVLLNAFGPRTVRVVTHLDVTADQVRAAAKVMRAVADGR